MVEFIKLFLLSYFIIIPVLFALLGRWFFGMFLSTSASDTAGLICGVGMFIFIVFCTIMRAASIFRRND